MQKVTPKPSKTRRNRKRPDWKRTHRTLRRFCALAFIGELAFLLLANPFLRVTKVRVDGARTVSAESLFEQARVPEKTNIFLMALREPLGKRLEKNPVIESATRTIELPDTLILTVRERQPYAVLAAGGVYWELDKNGVPFRQLDAPTPGLPQIEAASGAGADEIVLGRKIASSWLRDAYALLTLLSGKKNLEAAMIKVDQNSNLCLNRSDNLQIRLGQPEELPYKVALAQAAVTARDGKFAREASYIDVSCPDRSAWMPRDKNADAQNADNDGKTTDAHGRFSHNAAP